MSVQNYLEHPSDESLEQFVMNRLGESELEYVETHIMACEPCISKLELLEDQMAAMQIALRQAEAERVCKEAARSSSFWQKWFSVPNLSWAAAAAGLALCLLLGPRFVPASVQVGAERGDQAVIVPENRPLNVSLNAVDVPEGQTRIQIVSDSGNEVWSGNAAVRNGKAAVSMPAFKEPGVYFVRLYPAAGSASEPTREFRLEAK